MAHKDKKEKYRATNKWVSEHYDRINLTIPKGQKTAMKELAHNKGMSVNGLINHLIKAELAREEQ